MAALASFIFTLTLVSDSLEPRIDWVFTVTTCESCTEAQIQVMGRYFLKGDRIFIQAASKDKKKTSELVARFDKAYPGVSILKKSVPYPEMSTGWILKDPVTSEVVLYFTRKHRYGTFRSQTMLEMFRDPLEH